jgi:hypothetical protein
LIESPAPVEDDAEVSKFVIDADALVHPLGTPTPAQDDAPGETRTGRLSIGAEALVGVAGPGSQVLVAGRPLLEGLPVPRESSIEVQALAGEHLEVPERVVVAPATGAFRPHEGSELAAGTRLVRRGQVIGTVVSCGHEVVVESMFTGHLMGVMAAPMERVREGQPLVWLRSVDDR